MKTLMVDMDNVITDGMFFKYINEYLNTDYKLSDMTEYYCVQKLVGDNPGFWDYVSSKNFYDNAPLLDDCYDVLEKLNKRYDLYIVTAYLWRETEDISGTNLMNKYYYLREKLPFIKPEKYIFCTNKNILNFDIRIDDKITNLDGSEIKLLFTSGPNKNISNTDLEENNIIRVNNWKEVEKVLIDDNL